MATFPTRKSLAMTTFISATVMIVALLFTNAHNAPLDELGCHHDPPGSKYHCHTGALKGKEFENKQEAERSIASVKVAPAEKDFAVTYEDTPEAIQEKAEKAAQEKAAAAAREIARQKPKEKVKEPKEEMLPLSSLPVDDGSAVMNPE